jgi:hypothetical protein
MRIVAGATAAFMTSFLTSVLLAADAGQSLGAAASAAARSRTGGVDRAHATEAKANPSRVETAPQGSHSAKQAGDGGANSGGGGARTVYTNDTLLELRDQPRRRGTFSSGPEGAERNEGDSSATSSPTSDANSSPGSSSGSTTQTAPAPAAPAPTAPIATQRPPAGAPQAAPAPTPTPTPTPAAGREGEVRPIPELARWEAQMVTYGRKHCEEYDRSLTPDQKLGNTYYDAMRVFYQIADYTGDAFWNDCALKARAVYRDYYIARNNAVIPGYWHFTTGLRMDAERRGDARSKAAAIDLSRKAAYAPDTTPLAWTATAYRSREVAYAMVSYLNAEQLGEPRRERLMAFGDQALAHVDQWFVSKTFRAPSEINQLVPGAVGQYYIQPFMVALTSESLIRYWEATRDPRVLPAVKTAIDWLWAKAWVPGNQAFWYQNWVSDPRQTFRAEPGAPDLNLLIAPAFAWVYTMTGDTTYRDRGDQIFAGGVRGAWLGGGKQFNQNYMLSFNYVALRSVQ